MIERVVKVTNVSQFNVVLWAIISKQFLSEQWDIGNLESRLNNPTVTASIRIKNVERNGFTTPSISSYYLLIILLPELDKKFHLLLLLSSSLVFV